MVYAKNAREDSLLGLWVTPKGSILRKMTAIFARRLEPYYIFCGCQVSNKGELLWPKPQLSWHLCRQQQSNAWGWLGTHFFRLSFFSTQKIRASAHLLFPSLRWSLFSVYEEDNELAIIVASAVAREWQMNLNIVLRGLNSYFGLEVCMLALRAAGASCEPSNDLMMQEQRRKEMLDVIVLMFSLAREVPTCNLSWVTDALKPL